MNEISINAYAKINIGLDVLRKREDGYHDLRMIMQAVNLYDLVELSIKEEPDITLNINLNSLPNDQNNLVVKAAQLMIDTYRIEQGLEINLSKRIPIAAGLAGGSSDAAATLRGINEIFHLGASLTDLMELGVKIGADVPYCLLQGTALSEGIGEILTPLAPMPKCHIVLVKPNINVSTKYVYQNLNLNQTIEHPDIDGIIECISKNDLLGICNRLGNVLETVTISKYSKIKEIKDEMLSLGAIGVLMSGSGPTVFGIFEHYGKAKHCYDTFKNSLYKSQTFLTVPVTSNLSTL